MGETGRNGGRCDSRNDRLWTGVADVSQQANSDLRHVCYVGGTSILIWAAAWRRRIIRGPFDTI